MRHEDRNMYIRRDGGQRLAVSNSYLEGGTIGRGCADALMRAARMAEYGDFMRTDYVEFWPVKGSGCLSMPKENCS